MWFLKGYNIKRCLKYGLLSKNNNIGTNVLLNSFGVIWTYN